MMICYPPSRFGGGHLEARTALKSALSRWVCTERCTQGKGSDGEALKGGHIFQILALLHGMCSMASMGTSLL